MYVLTLLLPSDGEITMYIIAVDVSRSRKRREQAQITSAASSNGVSGPTNLSSMRYSVIHPDILIFNQQSINQFNQSLIMP